MSSTLSGKSRRFRIKTDSICAWDKVFPVSLYCRDIKGPSIVGDVTTELSPTSSRRSAVTP
jgi:hypothetical protein